MDKQAKVKHRRRVRLAVLMIFMIISFSFGFLVHAYAIGTVEAAESNSSVPIKQIYVVKGDTLWSIAQQHAPDHEDVRDYIQRVKKVNGLKSSALQTGQKLTLPN